MAEVREGARRARASPGRSWHAAGVILLLATSCTSGGTREPARSPEIQEVARGGTLRVGMVDALLLDPHLGTAYSNYNETWELLRCCLGRTLLAYPGLPGDEGGGRLFPDLARAMPDISADELTWTFRLRDGIRYGPPLEDVTISSRDIVRALERAAVLSGRGDPYVTPYSAIRGFGDFASGDASSISGLETPDDGTLVVRLTEPTGSLAAAFALPATAPIPPNPAFPGADLGVAAGHDFSYGRFLVSSGPYMIEGSEDLDLSVPPDEQLPIAGWDPGVSLVLVRNPSWDPSADELRPAIPDRIEFAFEACCAFQRIERGWVPALEAGSLDLVFRYRTAPPGRILARYRSSAELQDRLVETPADVIWFVGMNLAQAPFDDVHVRRAVSLALDRTALRDLRVRLDRSWGITSGVVATHLGFDVIEDGLLAGWDPYATEGSAGDVAKARREMALSRYDEDGDGLCDAKACGSVVAVGRRSAPSHPELARSVARDLRGIGIELDIVGGDPWERCRQPERHSALCIGPIGWALDYADPWQHFAGLFSSDRIACTDNDCGNVTLLGASPEQLEGWGYEAASVPSVDDRIDRCARAPGNTQLSCWAELDQYLMTEVVPLVPYFLETTPRILSERVDSFTFDQFAAMPALDRIVVSGESGPAPTPPRFPDVTSLSPGEPGIPEGTYVTEITREDLERTGLADRTCGESGEEISCVLGSYTLTLEEGRWRLRAQGGSWWSCVVPASDGPGWQTRRSGTYEAHGADVTFIADGALCPGVGFQIRARHDEGALSLRVLSVSDSLASIHRLVFDTHPWQRIDA